MSMDRREFITASAIGSLTLGHSVITPGDLLVDTRPSDTPAQPRTGTRKILIAGGGFNTAYIRYMAALSGKKRPRICYLPTASADAEAGIIRFYESCAPLDVEPHVQRSFIESLTQHQGWDDVFLSMDGIVVSGGNTLNQQAIWK
ncbi:MAG: Type 1 glutamine amidotransferase-like domain-containing protein, partial [Gemmatimonadetes bacterium]|nr:Type 1 glutamine amidotransferase-like domain-containing protein [Gemmatimonadota bacterium]